MGRPSHQPTNETLAAVKALAAFGTPHQDIARHIGINQDTLRKYYRDELDLGSIEANAKVGQYLFKAASGAAIKDGATHADCIRSAMFWAKTRMGWRETSALELTGKDGGPIRTVDMTDDELARIAATGSARASAAQEG